ncbi:MAG: TonB family protein [Cyclobacteriaceae bacterium]|jgi:protein TonB
MKNQDKYEKYGIYRKNKGHKTTRRSRKDDYFLISDLIKVKFAKASRQIRLSKLFFCIGLCISLLFTITAFEWKFYDDGKIVDLGNVSSTFEDIIDVPPTEQPPAPQPKIVQPKIIEVPDEEEIMEEIEIDLDIEMTEEQVIDQPVFVELDIEVQEEKAEEIFTIVEQQPEPIGGFSAFYKYVGENLKYPKLAQRGNIQGRVYIEFVVEKDGSLTDIKTMKGIGGGCDEEACRIIGNAPKWKPGKQRGRPVRVKMVIPILFRLEEAL